MAGLMVRNNSQIKIIRFHSEHLPPLKVDAQQSTIPW